MEDKNNQPDKDAYTGQIVKPATRANESAGLNIDEHLKIFDPESKQVWLEKRA
jgi:hypothetical protein